MPEPSVTAVIATYRAGDYLREAIASALAQDYRDFEVLVSDDANDPAVRRMAEAFGDPRVRYRSNPSRLGPAGNHWASFRDARGRYLAILNHDDLWRPGFLARAVPILETTPDAALVFCDHDVIDPQGRSLEDAADLTSERWGRKDLSTGLHRPFPHLVVKQTIPVAMGCLFRKDRIVPESLPDVGPAYDLWLAFDLCRRGGGAYYLKERLTAWRVHPEQITASRDEAWTRGILACWQAMSFDPLFSNERSRIRRNLSESARSLGVASLRAGRRGDAISAARVALGSRPSSWKNLALLALCLLPGRAGLALAGGRSR